MNKRLYLSVMMLLTLGQICLAQDPLPPDAAPPVGPPEVAAIPTCECACGVGYRFWARAEALMWWLEGTDVPPLVTTSPAGTARAQAGVLGTPGATVLFGGNALNDDARPGGRVSLGLWFDTCMPLGVEANFFLLTNRGTDFFANSLGNPILARPFFDVDQVRQDSELIAFPDVVTGSVQVATSSQFLGTETNLRESLWCNGTVRLDGIFGFRFVNLNEDLVIRENLTSIDPAGAAPVGTTFLVQDSFETSNSFYGLNMGVLAEFRTGALTLEVVAKAALGANNHDVNIFGFTTSQVPGLAPTTSIGGLLAQKTNIRQFSHTEFSSVEEFAINIRWDASERLKFLAGYSILYWAGVARPGEQIDFGVNATGIPPGTLVGASRPVFTDHLNELFVHGVNLGAEFRY